MSFVARNFSSYTSCDKHLEKNLCVSIDMLFYALKHKNSKNLHKIKENVWLCIREGLLPIVFPRVVALIKGGSPRVYRPKSYGISIGASITQHKRRNGFLLN
jgi:hypothetical protein